MCLQASRDTPRDERKTRKAADILARDRFRTAAGRDKSKYLGHKLASRGTAGQYNLTMIEQSAVPLPYITTRSSRRLLQDYYQSYRTMRLKLKTATRHSFHLCSPCAPGSSWPNSSSQNNLRDD